jgi:hypothetical protein
VSGQQQGLCALPRRRDAALNHQQIKAFLARLGNFR